MNSGSFDMAANLLCVGAAKADHADYVAAHGSGNADELASEATINAKARFVEAVVVDESEWFDIGDLSKRKAMLGDVRFVLRGVKFDVHAVYVYTITRLVKQFLYIRKRFVAFCRVAA